MKADILACYGGTTLLDKIISKVVGSNITHVVIDLGDGLVGDTGWTGVQITQLKNRNGQYVTLRYPELTIYQATKVIDYIKDSIGIGYDFPQLLSIFFFKVFGKKLFEDDKKKFICVELAIEAYNSVGIDIVPHITEKDMIAPSDLLNSPALTIIGEYNEIFK
jgi:hypothetical protein